MKTKAAGGRKPTPWPLKINSYTLDPSIHFFGFDNTSNHRFLRLCQNPPESETPRSSFQLWFRTEAFSVWETPDLK